MKATLVAYAAALLFDVGISVARAAAPLSDVGNFIAYAAAPSSAVVLPTQLSSAR